MPIHILGIANITGSMMPLETDAAIGARQLDPEAGNGDTAIEAHSVACSMTTTFTRKELYELVWSTPIVQLAEQLGFSDRGLAKVCERHQIPVPGRGHWARLAAGKNPTRTPLWPVADKALQSVYLNQSPIPSRSAYLDEVLASTRPDDRPLPVVAHVAPVPTPKSQRSLPIIDEPEIKTPLPPRGKTHPGVRQFIADLTAIPADREGFVYRKYVKVAPKDISRVSYILSGLLYGLEGHGFSFDDTTNRISFVKDGVEVGLGIEAPRKRVEETRKSAWNRYNYIHIGRLHLTIYGWADGVKKRWTDTDSRKIEEELDRIVYSFRVNHEVARQRAEEKRQEQARRAHMAMRRKMAELRVKREEDRLAYLRWIADARREADDLRATIALVSRDSGPRDDYKRMIEWAGIRLASLEEQTTAERIQSELEEQKLFADPDPLHDPEGEPPAKANSWDD
jgi:hypothetical protein